MDNGPRKDRNATFDLGSEFAREESKLDYMRTLIALLLWFLLLTASWPLALLVLFIFPVFWLLLLPFRIVGFTLGALLEAVMAILLFPFRLLKKMTS